MLKRYGIAEILVLLLAVCMIGAAAVSVVRTAGVGYFQPDREEQMIDRKLASQWLAAVRAGDKRKAVNLAKRIVVDYEVELPELDYIDIFKQNGITSVFLTDHFNDFDFYRWRDILFFHDLAQSKITDPQKDLEQILALVGKTINYNKATSYPPLTLLEIWSRKKGNHADRIRVFAELARQCGYKVKVIALTDPATRRFKYLLCEVSKNGCPAVVDLGTGHLWRGVSIWALGRQPERLPVNWSDSMKKMIRQPKALLAAELADYRLADQLLYRNLKEMLPAGQLPRFSNNPVEELDLYRTTNGSLIFEQLGYWQTPLIALHSMKKQAPGLWFYPDRQKNGDISANKDEK